MTAYTLFGQGAAPAPIIDMSTYTLGMQFSLTQAAALTGIWFYSGPGALALPVACCIYQETSPGAGSQVTGTVNTSPAWSGAAGSGWVKVAYDGTVTLQPGNTYKVCVLKDASSPVYSASAHYWDTGAGSGGLTSGPITAPASAGGDGGQDTFVNPSAALAYPASSFNATNYWADVEVTIAAAAALPVVSFVTDNRPGWFKKHLLGVG